MSITRNTAKCEYSEPPAKRFRRGDDEMIDLTNEQPMYSREFSSKNTHKAVRWVGNRKIVNFKFNSGDIFTITIGDEKDDFKSEFIGGGGRITVWHSQIMITRNGKTHPFRLPNAAQRQNYYEAHSYYHTDKVYGIMVIKRFLCEMQSARFTGFPKIRLLCLFEKFYRDRVIEILDPSDTEESEESYNLSDSDGDYTEESGDTDSEDENEDEIEESSKDESEESSEESSDDEIEIRYGRVIGQVKNNVSYDLTGAQIVQVMREQCKTVTMITPVENSDIYGEFTVKFAHRRNPINRGRISFLGAMTIGSLIRDQNKRVNFKSDFIDVQLLVNRVEKPILDCRETEIKTFHIVGYWYAHFILGNVNLDILTSKGMIRRFQYDEDGCHGVEMDSYATVVRAIRYYFEKFGEERKIGLHHLAVVEACQL